MRIKEKTKNVQPSYHRSPFAPAAIIALAYLAVGWCAFLVSSESGAVTYFWPGAGIALAACMAYGAAGAWGTFTGALLLSLVPGVPTGLALRAFESGSTSWLLFAALCALQALFGAWATRRSLGWHPPLERVNDYLRLVFHGGLLPSLVALALVLPTAIWSGAANQETLTREAWNWVASTTAGVAICTPVGLCFAPEWSHAWRTRRFRLAIPMILTTLTFGWAAVAVSKAEHQRIAGDFEKDANIAAAFVTSGLQGPLLALRAVHGLFNADATASPAQMRATAAWWLDQQFAVHAVGFSQHIKIEDVPAHESRMRREGSTGYKVFNREGPGAVSTLEDRSVVVVRYSESKSKGPGPIGFNALSGAASRAAILAAWKGKEARATEGFALVRGDDTQYAVVLYLPIFDSSGQHFRGVAFVAASMQSLLNSLMQSASPGMLGCISDVTDPKRPTFLAGPPNCQTWGTQGAKGVRRPLTREVQYAGRVWQLRLEAGQPAGPSLPGVQMFEAAGIIGAGLLCAFLLYSTGHTNRVEQAVEERTATLQAEVERRKQTEASWRTSEARLRAIFDSAGVGIVYADIPGRIMQVNQAYSAMLGYSEFELMEMSVADVTHPNDRALDEYHFRRLERGEVQAYRLEKRYVRRDGTELPVQTSVALIRTPDGHPYAAVGVVEDISERLRLADAELARDAAQAASKAKSEFVSRMSHELRTPLNAMLGFGQLLTMDDRPSLSPHQMVWAHQIQEAGWHLLRMINDTLDLSLIEAGALSVKPERVALGDLLEGTLTLVRADAEKRQVRLHLETKHPALELWCDPTRTKQVLTNLLSNAIKYNDTGGSVYVTACKSDGANAELAITDTGVGMTADQVTRLFQPYERLGREMSTVPGTGIGLVITQRLVQSMNGSIQVRSSPGVGTTFTVHLPLFREAPEVDAPAAVRHAVHYIEDNETNVELMRGVFARYPHAHLSVSTTGLEGIQGLRAKVPVLLLLDMHLPDIDGLDVLRELRADSAFAELPVVILSADPSSARVRAAKEMGVKQYLTKPLDMRALQLVLDELIPQSEASAPA